MKTNVPLYLTFTMGVLMLIQYFIPHPASEYFYNLMLDWGRVIGIFALVIGLSSLMRLHGNKIKRKVPGWGFSVVTLVSLVATFLIGLLLGVEENSFFMNIYTYIQIPLQATMFSLLAFYISSAAYRAFRARNWQASLLLVAGVIVMLGRIPLGDLIWGNFSALTRWIMLIPTTAAMRGIELGVGLGIIATSIKIILGIERGYLGGGG
ncbi:hypothetical protein JW905_16550 [bacterium]|nr:hypothetical protein [candidate division CSSED10-310 bacterium]